MKAAVIYEHGGLDKVTVADAARPAAAAGEVVVQVRCAAINHLDIWVVKGRGGGPMPHVLGSDAAGTVEEVGEGVHNVKAGDEVLLNPGLSCGCCEFCRRGEQSECTNFGILGLSRQGTFAEYIAVPASCVYRKPEQFKWEQAAALPLAYVTAWRMLMTRGQLRPGETVLIHGIGGGVATASLQLARMAGADVIVTSSSNEKLARAKQRGANHLINYKAADVAAAVKELTGGRGVDLVVDTVGAATWPVDFAAVRRGGRIVNCGVTSGAVVETNMQQLYWNQVTILGSTMGSDEDFRQMLRAVEKGGIAPAIDSVYPLGEVREAMTRMEQGAQVGKIVLRIRE